MNCPTLAERAAGRQHTVSLVAVRAKASCRMIDGGSSRRSARQICDGLADDRIAQLKLRAAPMIRSKPNTRTCPPVRFR